MQRLAIVLALSVPLTVGACGKSQLDDKPSAEVKDATPQTKETKDGADAAKASAESETVALDAAASSVGFVGAKVTGDHAGTFETITGQATLEGDTPVGLEVTVTIDSLKIEPEKLRNHLLDEDFFLAAEHPEAKFVATSIKEQAGEGTTHVVEGNLTLRGTTKGISFPATVSVTDAAATGTAEFKINRKDFGIEYDGMADDIIEDDVLLTLDLSFPRS